MPIDPMRLPSGASPDRRLTASNAPLTRVSAVREAPTPLVSREVVVSGCVNRRHSFDLCSLMRLPTQLTGPLDVGTLAVYERDGLPLGDDEGGIGLISTGDLRVALRQVRALKRLTVHLADPHTRCPPSRRP
ncbi:putative oxidoreductase, molybdopterin binding protein [Pandoraea horticolens]|uniref:Putative oxidoreductase, molybdopterin binding protein n=1 Tax=Pandoraea horticolens TaxID=2508298 RepID=A0A5E4RXU3_9BURK|nr:hypothetical protein [Pandoraea horticolens]VVD68087.1 putative oxidoreductase, molybdopterin binding protein [Pandoraea horticolens]